MIRSLAKILIVTALYLVGSFAYAQELNCQVEVVSPQVQLSNKRVFETLKQAVFEFMNNTSWTEDQYDINERIDCNIQINVTEADLAANAYAATIQVQYSRPVYGTNYKSLVFNFSDQDFNFNYIEYEQLQFNVNSHLSNLTSVLAYYAYIILGLDYDTFSMEGGTNYFQKAQQIVNNAQTASQPGWKAFESDRNRHALVENLMSATYAPLRKCLYKYHREAFDNMLKDKEASREKIIECLRSLEEVHNVRPGSFIMQIFFTAKSDELIKTFSGATSAQKTEAVTLLKKMDPANADKYNGIMNN